MRKVITLTLEDHNLANKLASVEDDVIVVLDTSRGLPFAVDLPDLFSRSGRELLFKNLPVTGSGGGAEVIINTISGQRIDNYYHSYSVLPYESASFCTNMKNTWLATGGGTPRELVIGIRGLTWWKVWVNSVGALCIDYDRKKGVGVPDWSTGYVKYDGKGTFV